MLYSQTMENSILFVLSMFNRLLPLDWFIGEHFFYERNNWQHVPNNYPESLLN